MASKEKVVIIDNDVFYDLSVFTVFSKQTPIKKIRQTIKSQAKWIPQDVLKDIDDDISDSSVATTYYSGEKPVLVIFWDKVDFRTIVHEVYHYVVGLCKAKGIRDEESHAYLMEYYVDQVKKAFSVR